MLHGNTCKRPAAGYFRIGIFNSMGLRKDKCCAEAHTLKQENTGNKTCKHLYGKCRKRNPSLSHRHFLLPCLSARQIQSGKHIGRRQEQIVDGGIQLIVAADGRNENVKQHKSAQKLPFLLCFGTENICQTHCHGQHQKQNGGTQHRHILRKA